jgi:tetratricopeptide (TPR) repeat protein
VQTTEYPFEWLTGKALVSVDAELTDPVLFSSLFPAAGPVVSADDADALRTVFIDSLGEPVCLAVLGSERAYLLGMAYLKGFGLERDFGRGILLLEESAEDCSFAGRNAAKQLADIYENNTMASFDLDKALYWRERVLAHCKKLYGLKHPDTASAYHDIATTHRVKGEYSKALKWYLKALKIREKVLGEHLNTADTYNSIALTYGLLGDSPKSVKWYKKALKIREKVLGNQHLDTAKTYNEIAGLFKGQGDAMMMAKRTAEKQRNVRRASIWRGIAMDWYQEALDLYRKSMEISEMLLGRSPPKQP